MDQVAFTEFPIGQRMPGTDWIVHGVIGQGGMGIVLEVRKGRNLRAAMKVLRPMLARSAEFEAQFAEEVELMARLRHPNIVEVWDCGILADGSPFFLMELLTGRTLRAVARDKDILFSAETLWKIVGQICAGLGHAHNADPPVIHRDVKPANVFLHGGSRSDAKVKLLDFGIANVLGTARSGEEVAGTPRYMAPEVLRNEPFAAKADLYALAVLVYELLTQGFPWHLNARSSAAMSEAHLKIEPLAPSHWKRWIPKSVDDCLLRALSKDPNLRQQSVAEFHEQLAELQFVDDGSAKYRMDGPTVPTVETMARGRAAAVVAPADADSAKRTPPAAAGGWLQAARSRLGDDAAEADDAAPPATTDVPAARAAASERPAPVDAPPRASAGRVKSRIPPAAFLLGAGAIVVAGGWSGWKARLTSPAATRATLPIALPSAVSRVAQETELPYARPDTPRSENAAPDAGGALITAAAAPSAPERVRVHRPSRPPRQTKGASPSPSSSNLDDVLFGSDDAIEKVRAPSSAGGARGL